MDLFRSTFRIAPENFANVAKALCDSGIIPLASPSRDGRDVDMIEDTLRTAGLLTRHNTDGIAVVHYWTPGYTKCFDVMEKVFKEISRSVEPGGYIELLDGETLIRYVFLYDTVERWTVPHILYTKKEAI